MAEELYNVLGVKTDATQTAIKKAYRALAKKHHPDLNPGNKMSEETFRKAQTAYDILSDEEKRRRYDAGELDADGQETHREFYHEYATADAGHPYSSTANVEDFGDVFSSIFGAQQRDNGSAHLRIRGGDIGYKMEVTFLEAANGAKKRITMPDGKSLNIAIPVGHRDGQMLRLKGKGMPGHGGGDNGDAIIEVHTKSHRIFRWNGPDILVNLPVAIDEAILGAQVRVPTIRGSVNMSIPAGSNTGDILRLKGKGIEASGKRKGGDQLVTISIVLPKNADETLHDFVEGWAKDHKYDPRQGMEG